MARAAAKGKATTVTATELFLEVSKVLSRVQFAGERIIVTRNGKPAAVLAPLSPADLQRLEDSAA